VKLLYVTPEQLVKSDSLRGLLQDLRQRQLLARFVIDEVRRAGSSFANLQGKPAGSGVEPAFLVWLVSHVLSLTR
jgi:hypothetical protein